MSFNWYAGYSRFAFLWYQDSFGACKRVTSLWNWSSYVTSYDCLLLDFLTAFCTVFSYLLSTCLFIIFYWNILMFVVFGINGFLFCCVSLLYGSFSLFCGRLMLNMPLKIFQSFLLLSFKFYLGCNSGISLSRIVECGGTGYES